MIWPSVQAAFLPFTSPLEGVTTWMYLDEKGLVTTGIGDLVDPMAYAMVLPWVHRTTGWPALPGEVAAAWSTVKSAQSMARLGGGAFQQLTDLRLTADGVTQLVNRRLQLDAQYLAARFAGFSAWPADAQLGTISIAWAAGPGWAAPKFAAAVEALDFAACAGTPGIAGSGECWLNDAGNPGLRPRNLLNQRLFANAAQAVKNALPFDQLIWEPSN